MNPELDPVLLAELRDLHRSERATAALEQSVLARLLPSRGKAPLGARLRAGWGRAPLGLAVLGSTLGMAAVGAMFLGGRMYLEGRPLATEESPVLGPEPRLEAAGEAREAAPCPLDDLPPGFVYEPTRMDPAAASAGLQLDTFPMPIPGCPDLVRRTLRYVPRGLVRGPVLIVLHDGGSSAESVRALHVQGRFEALAESGFVVVYANAAPAAGHPPDSGLWQTDAGAHGTIDDLAYLARVVERLDERGLLYKRGASGPDVFLFGYGSGADLALEAAAQHPDRYAGVAAILPGKVNRSRPRPRGADTRLTRLMFVTQQEKSPRAYSPGAPLDVAMLEDWKAAMGLPLTAQRRSMVDVSAEGNALLGPAIDEAALLARRVVPAGTRVFDSAFPDKGGAMLRAVVVQSKAAFDVGPGGSPAPVDAAALAWEFFQRGVPGYPDL